jgi:hypothetical protein
MDLARSSKWKIVVVLRFNGLNIVGGKHHPLSMIHGPSASWEYCICQVFCCLERLLT